MTKDEIKVKIGEILESHDSELKEILNYGYNIDIRLEKGKPAKINFTMIELRKSGIRITHDGQTDDFSSQEALLFAIKQIGCERFYNAQKRSKVINRIRPTNVKDSQITELKADNGLWYVNMNSGIDQRVAFLNNILKVLNLDWKAERWDI